MDFLKCILTAVGKRVAAAAGDIPGCAPPPFAGPPPPAQRALAAPGARGLLGEAGAAWGLRGLMKHLMCIAAGQGETRTPPSPLPPASATLLITC